MDGVFNLFVHSNLDAQGANLTIKNKTLAELIEIKSYDLGDIWRVRNAKSKRFAFAQKKFSSLIQRRPDSMFISNTLQEFVTMTEILTPMSTDHLLVPFSLSEGKLSLSETICCLTKTKNVIEIKKLFFGSCITNKFLFNRELKSGL